jgi:hypothetical protein
MPWNSNAATRLSGLPSAPTQPSRLLNGSRWWRGGRGGDPMPEFLVVFRYVEPGEPEPAHAGLGLRDGQWSWPAGTWVRCCARRLRKAGSATTWYAASVGATIRNSRRPRSTSTPGCMLVLRFR